MEIGCDTLPLGGCATLKSLAALYGALNQRIQIMGKLDITGIEQTRAAFC